MVFAFGISGLKLASFKQAAELERVLDETAASHEELKAAHQATIVELNRLKQWVFGRRSERIVDGEGQRHLFDLQPEATGQADTSVPEPPGQQVTAHRRRRRRELDLDKRPQNC